MANRINRWWQQWMIASDEVRTRTGDAFHHSTPAGCSSPPTGHGTNRTKLALQLDQLEPRLLFSATPLDVAAMDQDGDGAEIAAETAVAESETESIQTLAESSNTNQTAHEIVFIDSSVPDLQQLLDDLNNSDRNLEVVILEADRDGIDQITELLDSRSDVSSIHIVSHAENGSVKLGNLWLGESNLDAYAGQLASWQSAMTADADILLYGCDLADTPSGESFLESISALTGADVAASTDDTGHATFAANWDLEYATGSIETNIVFSADLQENWFGKLATITVTTHLDVVDGDTSSVSNLQGNQGTDNLISLREAILAVNEGAGGDTILLGAETYTLARTGEDNTSEFGDLDLLRSVTIIGIDARSTIIDGGGIDRVFHIHNDSTIISMSNITIQGGSESHNGGGIFVDHDSTLNLTNVALLNNDGNNASGGGRGGALHVHGTLNADRVTFSGNTAVSGAAIFFHDAVGGTLTNVTISGNTATSQGGGIYTDNTEITINHSTITNNHATDGGGIRTSGAPITLANTIIAGNSADSASTDVLGSFISNGFNLIEDLNGTSGFGDNDITGVSAGLDALANNGGQVDSHALLVTSAALNAGNSLATETQDQTGRNRDAIPDIGAFESQHASTKIYWADEGSGSIFRSNGDGTAIQRIAEGLGRPSGLEVDLAGGKLYWIETDTNSLHWSNLDGSEEATLNTNDLVRPTGLGLDLINGYLYVADDGNGIDDAIHRFDLDGNNFTTIVTHLNGIIGDVAVDGVTDTIYFTSHNNGIFDGEINSVNTSGGTVSTLRSGLVGPRSLVIDQTAGRLYFADDGDGSIDNIVSLSLSDSSDLQTIASSSINVSQPHGIAVDSTTGKVYWSDAINGLVHRSNLDGSSQETILSGLNSPNEIVVAFLSGQSTSNTPTNNAPTISDATLAAVSEDATTPAGDTIANLFGGTFSDVDDPSSLSGVAVVANGANATNQGVWQYSSNGTDWFGIGSVDDSGNALLISVSSKIRFVPAADFNGSPTAIVVRAIDNSFDGTFSTTSGNESRQTADTSSLTSTSAISNSTNTLGTSVTGTNDLPSIGGVADGTVNDNATTEPFSAVTITDVDGDNVTVVVTVAAGDTNGIFTAASLTASGFSKTGSGQYTLTSGATAAAQSAIRQLVFDPTENQATVGSSVDTQFTISVNDTNPAVVDSTTNITVTSINDAPAISDAALAAIAQENMNPAGETVANLWGTSFVDADQSSSFRGIVVVGNPANTGDQGAWQYSSNGSDWFNIGTVDDSGSGLAIASGSKVRFLPLSGFSGAPASLVVRGLDNTFAGSFSTTSGTESRQVVDATTPTGTSAFSSVTATLATSVTANAAPVIGGTAVGQAINDNQTATPLSTVTFTDNENDSITVVITLSGGDANGQFTTASLTSSGFTKTDTGEYSLAQGTTASAQTAIRSLVFAPTPNQVAVGSTVTTTIEIAINDGTSTTDSNATVIATSINDVATNITLSNANVPENSIGAAIGSVGVVDPDAGDTHSLAVDDARFEIVGTTLKLKAGNSLDRETDPTILIMITATDQSGDGMDYSESFSVTVNNVNEVPTDIMLDNTTVQSGSSGVRIGQVAAIDPDNGDTHTLQVDDSRFSIDNGVLTLKPGQSVDASSEPIVTLVITATDADGLTITDSFDITVIPTAIPIPIPIVPIGGEGTNDSSPTDSRNEDNSKEDQPDETDSSERSSDEENSSSSEDADQSTKNRLMGAANKTIGDNIAASSVAASSIIIGEAGQGTDTDGNSSLDSLLTHSVLNASSAYGSSISTAANAALDRFASGLIRYGLGTTSFAASQANLAMMMKPGEMWSELDQQMQGVESQIKGDLIIVGAAGAATSSFMVGVAAWGLRTGFLASGLMAQLPAWRAVDPMLIMQGSGDGDNESLEELMKRHSDELDELDAIEHSVGEAIS